VLRWGPDCGCERLRQAENELDPGVVAAISEHARADQQTWRCPFAGHGDPDHAAEPLPDEAREQLRRLQVVTGLPVENARTCPRYYATTPLAQATCLARKRLERRAPLGAMPAALVLSVEALDAALDARSAHEHAKFEEEMKQRREEAERRSSSGGNP
jgi:hypothetical protein